MLKKLVALLAKMVGLEVQEKKPLVPGELEVKLADGDTVVVKNKESAPRTERTGTNRPQEEMRKLMNDIMSQIGTKGYQKLPEILLQYDIDVIENYVRMQLIALNMYDKESSDIESLSIDELVEQSVELNQMQYEQRMIDQGRANITQGQVALIKRLATQANVEVTMPSNKFEASRLIEKLNKKLGREPRTAQSGATQAQMRKLGWLVSELGVTMPTVNTIKEASDQIQALQTVYDTKRAAGEIQEKMCTQAQLTYMKRLYKLAGKRWIKTSANKFMKLTVSEMSKEIESMKATIEKDNPEINLASQGQVNYIVSLCSQLNIPYNIADIKKMRKESATAKIDSLRRKQLVILSETLSKEDVAKMTSQQVSELLKNINMERRTTFYTEDPDVVDNKYGTIY